MEVKVDSKCIDIDDFLVFECLKEGRIGIGSKLGEGQTDKALIILEVVLNLVGDQNGLIELMVTNFDFQLVFISEKFTVQVPNLVLFASAEANLSTLIPDFGFSCRFFSLDENITGA